MRLYGYSINLDERGGFYADVRDESGETIFEIRDGNELGEDESSIFEDGFMRGKNDLDGLASYLISIKLIPEGSRVLTLVDQEAALEERSEDQELKGEELTPSVEWSCHG